MKERINYYFGTVWGLLLVVMVLATLLLAAMSMVSNELLQPVATIRVGGPIAFICTFVIAFYMFSVRDDLYRLDSTREFRENKGRPLAVWALIFFLIAILLAFFLAFALTTHSAFLGPEGVSQSELTNKAARNGLIHMLIKLTMTGALVFVFVFFALSAGFMGVHDYGKQLAQDGHLPEYMDIKTLKREVLTAANEELNVSRDAKVSEMKRLPSGGISLKLYDQGQIVTQDSTQFREDRVWSIKADYAGNLVEVIQEPPRLVKLG